MSVSQDQVDVDHHRGEVIGRFEANDIRCSPALTVIPSPSANTTVVPLCEGDTAM
jgi:hypothetical protein